MKSFLQHVAEDIIGKHGNDLSHIAVVFPNKRAALFLNSHLAALSQVPIWSPSYVTISDLFRSTSTLMVADSIKLVCELHKSFVSQTGIDETLDHFYGWGQLLLADFDDLDKNMADADKVLANLRDIHELDDVDYLTDTQKEVISRFFSNFSSDHNTILKERFLKLWSRMADIYHDFNDRLSAQGLAYEGALYRQAVEHLATEGTSEDRQANGLNADLYIFVGFNMVQQVEQRLFKLLMRQGRARFYWDYDDYYLKDNEAGHFISQYLPLFPNELQSDATDIYRCFTQPKHISFVSAPTENIQARYINQWLQSQGRIEAGRRTAVVLANEALLPMAIHCLPDRVEKVNITTGFPLVQSPVASLITLLISLQVNGYVAHREVYRLHHVNMLLRHPFLNGLVPEIATLLEDLNQRKIFYPNREQLSVEACTTLLFKPLETGNQSLLQWMCDVMQMVARQSQSDDPLFQEAVFRAYTLLNRLLTLVADGDLTVDVITLQRLIYQLVQSTSIPFHGEPAEGLQVMGVLETRNLDFDHLLLLSCNEGNLPRGINDTSFIPYSIRKAYGLTTIDHKVAIFSYYFHRMIQRVADVTIVYNNATTDGQTGEMSRFMLQMLVEDGYHHIDQLTLQAPQAVTPFIPTAVEKTPEVMKRLLTVFDLRYQPYSAPSSALLSPTAINHYLRCPLIFYYRYVHALREPNSTDDDVIDNRLFGNIFHEASRIVYKRLTAKSRHIVASDIEELLKTKIDIERAVDEAFRKELFQIRDPQPNFHPELNGLHLINREVIIHYLRQLLDIDRRLAPFTIMGIECDVFAPLQTTHLQTVVGGRIDRLDCIVKDGENECIRVIDYKTGSSQPRPLLNVDAVFKPENLDNHSDYYLQTLLYACIVRAKQPQLPVAPALLFIQHAGADNFDPVLRFDKTPINDVAEYRQRFSELLRETVEEMFNPDIAFTPTANRERCQNCSYRQLCSL